MSKISIIIPTLNSAKTIGKTVQSVLKQTFRNFEIIILDSFSNDDTISIVKKFQSKKIKIFFISKKKKTFRYKILWSLEIKR